MPPPAEALKRQRLARGLRQTDLASAVGCSVSYVRLIESGFEPDSGDVLPKILEVLFGDAEHPAERLDPPHAYDNDDRRDLPTLIREARRLRRWSQARLSMEAGCSMYSIAQIESGAVPARSRVLPKVLRALEL